MVTLKRLEAKKMNMTETLEKDKDHLVTELAAAGTAEKAVKILERETDKLLLVHNERCSSDAARDTAAFIMQAVRLSLPLIDSTGKTKVWERGAEDGKTPRKVSVAVIFMLIAGIVLCAFGLIPLIMLAMSEADASSRTDLITRSVSVVMGICVLFLAGSVNGRPRERSSEYHVEIHVDADRLYRYYRTVILSVDQSLDEVRNAEEYSRREQAGNIDGRPATTPELELFSDLLAASYSEDPEYALEKISEIKYYLHRQQIEVVDYSEETQQFFDLMPGVKKGTIRPALVADGILMKKGLASTGK